MLVYFYRPFYWFRSRITLTFQNKVIMVPSVRTTPLAKMQPQTVFSCPSLGFGIYPDCFPVSLWEWVWADVYICSCTKEGHIKYCSALFHISLFSECSQIKTERTWQNINEQIWCWLMTFAQCSYHYMFLLLFSQVYYIWWVYLKW